MPTYQRSVRVEAPLETVWDFHSTTDGLEALTPDWLHLEIKAVRGPEGEADPDVLEAGSEIYAAVKPFGVLPGDEWISRITQREQSSGSAVFRDVMVEGPFESWEHTHLFYADGDETIVRDVIEYEFPPGLLGELLGQFGPLGFEPMFWFRHRRTKALLE